LGPQLAQGSGLVVLQKDCQKDGVVGGQRLGARAKS
jgi:hypothetical protein